MIKDKRILILTGAIVASLVLIVVTSLIQSRQTQDLNPGGVDSSIPDAPQEATQNSEGSQQEQSQPEDEDHDSIYIKNFSKLSGTFSVGNALFINNTIQKFAVANNFSASGLELDEVSFNKRDADSWGFMVRDNKGNRIFYVIVTQLPEGNVKVEEFLQ